MMKRLVSWLLCLVMLAAVGAYAEPVEEVELESKVVVGSTTSMSGVFFTDMWGNNTADVDVRALLHDYSTVAWAGNGNYIINPTSVADAQMTEAPDGSHTYTFTIHEDLVYSDGTPITARDYVFSALFLSAPQVKELGALAESLSHITGHEAFSTGASNVFSGIRLLSDYQFTVTVGGEYLPYFYELAMVAITPYPISVIAPGCQIEDDGAGAYIEGSFTAELLIETVLNTRTGYMTYPKVTSGAYTLVSYDDAAHVAEFALNPLYKGNFEGQKPTIETIVFKQVKNATMLSELREGTVDVLNKVSSGEVITEGLEMFAAAEVNSVNYLRSGLSFVAFACEQPRPSSVNIRKAVALCLDKQAMVDRFLQGNGVPVYGYYGYGQWMIAQINVDDLLQLDLYEPDLNAAGQLLAADGWRYNADGTEFAQGEGTQRYRRAQQGFMEPLTLKYAKPADNPAADIVEELLRESFAIVGIGLETTAMDMQTLLQHYYRQNERTYDMFFLASNFSFLFDPFYTYNTADEYQGVMNTSGLRSEALMKLAADMRSVESGDMENYLIKWMDFQRGWVEELPLVPIASNIYFDFYRTDLNFYLPNAHWGWAAAILYATLGEIPEEELLEGELPEGEEIFEDGGDIIIEP